MGKIKFIILLSTCLLKFSANAADSTVNLKLLKTISINATNFSVDNLGNIYLITDNNRVKKLNEKWDSVALFNDVKRFGNIYSIDVSNPLKILVFYKDFLTVLVLDRFLNTRNIIDLRKQNIVQVKTICQSYDNNIWLFDELDATIKKIDDNGKLLLASSDFRLLFEEVPNPSTMVDKDGLLYLYNANNGFLVFDYYGAIKNTYPFKNWKDVQVNNQYLIGRDSLHLYKAKPQQLLLQKVTTNISIKDMVKVVNSNNLIYILRKDGLEIYSSAE